MKYIITSEGEAVVGGRYHEDMIVGLQGSVVRAGWCKRLDDCQFEVWGESIGYNMKALPEDAAILEELNKAGKLYTQWA